jgi:hypothetical protein
MKRLGENSAGILFGTALALLTFFAAVRVYVVHRAAVLIAEIKNIDQAPDPMGFSRALMQKYGDSFIAENCERDFCQIHYLLSNRLLSTLHFSPRSEIEVYFSMSKGSLNAVNVQYTSAVFQANSPVVHVQEDFCAARTDISCNYFALNPHGRNVSPTWNGDIEFGQLATVEEKRAAWALDLNCMTTFTGCKDIAELAPSLWKLTSPSAVSSRLRSTADSIAEASQPLPDK